LDGFSFLEVYLWRVFGGMDQRTEIQSKEDNYHFQRVCDSHAHLFPIILQFYSMWHFTTTFKYSVGIWSLKWPYNICILSLLFRLMVHWFKLTDLLQVTELVIDMTGIDTKIQKLTLNWMCFSLSHHYLIRNLPERHYILSIFESLWSHIGYPSYQKILPK
jgi:hypothetical protein